MVAESTIPTSLIILYLKLWCLTKLGDIIFPNITLFIFTKTPNYIVVSFLFTWSLNDEVIIVLT